jgi:HlyD family secretion protein
MQDVYHSSPAEPSNLHRDSINGARRRRVEQVMKTKWLLFTVAIVGIAGWLVTYFGTSGSAAAPQYLTAAVTRGDVVETVEATGTLEALETVEIGSQVSGSIKSLHADFNSTVKAGQVIARLEPSLFEAQVEQAKSSLLRLQAEVERARVSLEDATLKMQRAQDLWAKQLIARSDLEAADATARQAQAALKSAEAQLAQGEASLNQTQVNLSHTVIRAPIDGIVISRNVNVGQTVAASMSAPVLFVIARDLTRMRVNASIGEADIGRIAAGQPATFSVDAYPGRRFTGTVSQVRLQPTVESNVVSYVTLIDVANKDLRLKPGMTASISVEIARSDDALRVPTSALRFQPEGVEVERPAAASGQAGGRTPRREANHGDGSAQVEHVWVVRDGAPDAVAVEVGISDGTTTAITSTDLHEGSRVITGSPVAQTASMPAAQSPLMPAARGRGARGAGR